MNKTFWMEMSSCFDEIADDEDCRAVVVAAEGRVFTAGLDLGDITLVQVRVQCRILKSSGPKLFSDVFLSVQWYMMFDFVKGI